MCCIKWAFTLYSFIYCAKSVNIQVLLIESHVGWHIARASNLAACLSGPNDNRRGQLHNYEHKKLIESITKLDEVPADPRIFSNWIHADAHLAFLQENARADELVIFASGEYTFVHSVVVPNTRLTPIDQDDLMGWSLNPYTSIASYVMGGGRDDVWIERSPSGTGSKTLED